MGGVEMSAIARHRHKGPGHWGLRILLHAVLLISTVIWLYPLLWVVGTSLKTNEEYYTKPLMLLPSVPQWANYVRAWVMADFSKFFMNSVIISSSVTVIVIALSCITGYVLGRFDFAGRKVVLAVIASAMFLPRGYTIIPLYQLIKFLGLTNTLGGVIVAQAGGTPTLFILLFTAHFSSLPGELQDASEIDGAGFLRMFSSIFLPLARPILGSCAILRFLWAWNNFFIPLVFTLGKPELRTVSVGLFAFVGEHTVDNAGMMAGACIALLPPIVLFLVFQSYFIDTAAGAVKG